MTLQLVLPRLGRLPRVTCPTNVRKQLDDIVLNAGYEVPISSMVSLEYLYTDRPDEIAEKAVCRMLYEKWEGVPIPKFRLMVCGGRSRSKIRKALEVLEAELPDNDYFSPWAQMRTAYVGGDSSKEGCTQDGDVAREDRWANEFHPRTLKTIVQMHLQLMDALAKQSAGRRPPEAAERTFVKTLAHYWTNTLGLAILNGRRSKTQQQGDFADFVRAVADFYRGQLRDLPKHMQDRLRIRGTLDGHIRKVADQIRKNLT